MSDDNVFAPRNALRRTPTRAVRQLSPPSSLPVSLPRSMTSPLRDDVELTPPPVFSSSAAVPALSARAPRASTAEPTTPSYARPAPSSVAGTTARRKATTPHAIRGYSNRPTPHKNQGRRRTSRFAGEDDDLRNALRQFSRITAPTTKPFIPTPKLIAPQAASARRQTLTGIRLSRDLNTALDDDDDERNVIRPPPRLSNVSLKLIGHTITAAEAMENDDDSSISPPPQFTSPMPDADTPSGTPGEVARRAVADADRRMSFLPNAFDRFRDFDDVLMEDSVMQGVDDDFNQQALFDDAPASFTGEEGLSFADRTGELHHGDEDVSGFFNPQDLIPDDETDFRLEQVEPPVEEEEEGDYEMNEEETDNPLNPEANSLLDQAPEFVDSDFSSEDDELVAPDADIATRSAQNAHPAGTKRKRKELPLSAYGIPYPSMPPRVLKAMIARTNSLKLSKDALAAVAAASDAYFENLGEDLGSFARHAKRKTVEEADVLQVLRRHRLLSDRTTVFSLAAQHLPRELLQDVRIQVPKRTAVKPKRVRVPDEE